MNRFLIFVLSAFLLASCGSEEQKPEEVLEKFIIDLNDGKSISAYTNSSEIAEDYLETRVLAEKLNVEKIDCETSEESAICSCETESGRKRKFRLVKDEGKWVVDINAPEIILELFHIHYNTGNIKSAKKYATPTEKDRLQVFESLVDGMEFDASKVTVTPFEIKCKEFKKKIECLCTSAEGETAYNLYHSSKGWKAELGETDIATTDTLIDYNSPENFNLNQHDLDSLTEFSQKMLDSMLSL